MGITVGWMANGRCYVVSKKNPAKNLRYDPSF